MKRIARAFAVALGSAIVTACHGGTTNVATPLVDVSPLPVPSLPPLVSDIHPTKNVDQLGQIRVRFRRDLIPLEALEGPGERDVLAKFSLTPTLPGRFRFLTPRMIGFEGDGPLPPSSRIQVTIARGLADRSGATLDRDLTWTFTTGAVGITDLPMQKDATSEPEPGPLLPAVSLTADAALDLASLTGHASLVPQNGGPPVPLVVPSAAATALPSADPADTGAATYPYTLVPATALAKGTTYDIVIAPGVRPARGNLPTVERFRGRLRTYGPLRFTGLTNDTSDTSRFQSGIPTLGFANPIDPKSVARAVHVTPVPHPGTLVASIGNPAALAINPALLEPNTEYTVTVDATLADTFGQTLGQPERAVFRTTDRSPELWAPGGTHVFPATADVRLNVSAVNLRDGDVRARFVKLVPNDVVVNDDPTSDDSPVFAPAPWPVFPTAGTPNVERVVPVPLAARLGAASGVLAYGIAATTGTQTDAAGKRTPAISTTTGLVQLTDLGVFAQYFPDTGFVRVNRIAGGAPVAGARVEVFRSQAADKVKAPAAPPCAVGATDTDGIARFDANAFGSCAAVTASAGSAPALVTIVRDGNDWTYVRTDDGSGAYDPGLESGWSAAAPIARATIFSDRDLYQPGETAKLTAVGWFLTDGRLARGTAPSYTVELRRPDDSKLALPRLTLDAYGTGSIAIVLPKTTPLGYYTVHANAGNGEDFSGTFRVAEFKPPNFKVTLGLDTHAVAAGATVKATATSTYLFGAPVQSAATAYNVTRSISNYVWPKDEAYTFGRRWFWPDGQPSVSTDVKSATVNVDAAGIATMTIPVAADLPYPMAYRVDADTTDVANLTVGATASFTAFPGSASIGLKGDDIGQAGTPATLSVIAVDVNGTVAAGTKVHLELQAAHVAAATRVVEGSETAEQSVTYTTVAATDVTTAAGPVTAQMTPPAAGEYRIRANVAGAPSDASETDVQLFVTGAGGGAWGLRDANHLAVHLDKTVYRPGERARAVVQSPFPDADLLVAVVRHGVIWQRHIHASGPAATVAFPVTAEMLPNAAFEAVAVRRGALPKIEASDGGYTLARSGFAAFDVATDAKMLRVRATAVHATLRPAARQTIDVRLTDRAGSPVRGEVTLIVANEAILQLSGYRPPDLVKLVYAQQPISTRFGDNRTNVVLQTPHRTEEKGWGYGGGLSAGAEDTRIRHNFQPLAFYAHGLVTGADGTVAASFQLPDDVTTWRVMAVAATADGRFGNGESTFLTDKPLIASPIVPQFARPGDRFDAGLAVANPLGIAGGTLRLSGALDGPLTFLAEGAAARPSVTRDAPLDALTHAYRFPVAATGTGPGTVTFGAALTSQRGAARDGFSIPLEVTDRAVTESVVATGVTTSTATIPLAVASDAPADGGGLQLTLANSLLPDVLVAARSTASDTSRLTLTAAGRAIVAADALRLAAQTRESGNTGDTRKRLQTDLAFLLTQQRPDGGFSSYPGGTTSDPFDSLSVLRAYARAGLAGIPVDAASRSAAMAFAAKALADPGVWSWCKRDPCKSALRLHALDALADAGDRRTTYLGEIDAAWNALGLSDRIRLARYLLRAPGYAARGATEAATFGDERTYQTGALATVTLNERYGWFASPTVAHALGLQLLLAQHADAETIDRMTRGLLALRRNGAWGCTCATGAALDALVDVAAAAGPPPNLTVAATLRGTTIARAAFAGHRATVSETRVGAAALPRGLSALALTARGGALHYGVTYTYRLTGDQPGRLNGLRVTRVVHPAGATTVLATMGLALLAAPVTLDAARVFDVELQIVTDHPVDRVTIVDPLPAGLEAVDTAFATTTQMRPFGDGWTLDDQQIHHDRIEAYADHLWPGAYVMHYIARTVTPGTFRWPGAQAQLAGRPEEFGRSASAILVVPGAK